MEYYNTYTLFLSRYLSENFLIIPLRKDSNSPEISFEEYFKIFSDKEKIESLFNKNGPKNIGLITGTLSKIIAIEAHTKETVNFLEKLYNFQINSAKVETEKGRTYFFKVPGLPETFKSFQIENEKIKITVKANTDFSIIPPSKINGFTYRWHPSFDFFIPVINFYEFLEIIQQLKNIATSLNKSIFLQKNQCFSPEPIGDIIEEIKTNQQEETQNSFFNLDPYSYFETEKAFYTSCFSIQKRKRYAMLKKEKQIWEITEKLKTFKTKEEYLEDTQKSFETILIKKQQDIFNKSTLYSYVTINLEKHITNFIIQDGIKKRDKIEENVYYDFTILTSESQQPIVFKECNFDEFLNKIKNECLVISTQKVKDAISKCISDLINANKIKTKTEINKPGFFLSENENNQIITANLNIKKVSEENLVKALNILDTLVNYHYQKVKEKFVTILKWFLVAPFSYIVKKRKSFLKGLYLYGASGTGKSTICVLLSSIWGDFYLPIEKGGPSIDTIAKFGKTFGTSTFPEIISDPQGALIKDEIREAIKTALTGTIVRSKFLYGQYIHIPALANVVFTSNHFIPADEAFLRRFIVIVFRKKDAPSLDEKTRKKFAKARDLAEKYLPFIGNFIASNLNDEKLKNLILSLNDENALKIAQEILSYLFNKAKIHTPDWIYLTTQTEYNTNDLETDIKSTVFSDLRSEVIKELKNFKPLEKICTKEELINALKTALQNQLISFAIYKKDKVYLTKKILSTFTSCQFSNLKELAEIIGYPWETKSFKFGKKVVNLSVVSIPLQDFLELIFP